MVLRGRNASTLFSDMAVATSRLHIYNGTCRAANGKKKSPENS